MIGCPFTHRFFSLKRFVRRTRDPFALARGVQFAEAENEMAEILFNSATKEKATE